MKTLVEIKDDPGFREVKVENQELKNSKIDMLEKCYICNKDVNSKELELHFTNFHSETEEEKKEIILLKTNETSKKYDHKCDICGNTFKQEYDVIKHVNSVHKSDERFACNLCSKTYAQPGSLMVHIKNFHYGRR